jgi:uridine kinase
VFLLRPELANAWDLTILLHIPFEEVVRRAAVRDRQLLGGADRVAVRYQRRYIPGQRIYLETVRPASIADVVIDNTDPARPILIAWRPRIA